MEEEVDSIVEEHDDGGDDDCKMQGDDGDDEEMIRNCYCHSSAVQLFLLRCIVSVDVEWQMTLAWNWDRMVRSSVQEYDAYWVSEGRSTMRWKKQTRNSLDGKPEQLDRQPIVSNIPF